ncbi:Chondroitin synthase [Planctomyces sp. SH-PL62]|nr:Chondroitin synthase [Planctomyces sp. SH-PL62]
MSYSASSQTGTIAAGELSPINSRLVTPIDLPEMIAESTEQRVAPSTNEKSPRVSIGLAVFNGESFLTETVEAFIAQTFSDFELIISDNASTDGTPTIAKAFAARDSRIRYHVNVRNLGLAGNHNIVVHMARGAYFKWAAADDVCLPNYLARCVQVLDEDPSVVLTYPRTQFIDADGLHLDIEDPGWHLVSDSPAERLRRILASRLWMNAIAGLVRINALRKTRLMPAYSGGDYRVLAELSLFGKIHEIPETLFLRRLHADASSQHGTSGTNPDRLWFNRYMTGTETSRSSPQWRINIDHFRTITCSRLTLRQKASLIGTLLRRTRWDRDRLVLELTEAIPAYFRRLERR